MACFSIFFRWKIEAQHLKRYAKDLKPLTGLVFKTFAPHSVIFDLVVTFCSETCVRKKETSLLSEAISP